MVSPFVGDPGITPGQEAGQAVINQFGLDPSLVSDFVTTDRVPRTRTRTSHGLTIRVGGGRIIGAVQSLTHSQTRNIEDEWEVNKGSRGAEPADMVPQNVTSRTLTVSRFDLFVRNMEDVFSRTGEIVVLSDQFRPFSLRTQWQSPVGIVLGGRKIWEYTGCWFTRIGRTVRATDNRIVSVDAEITYKLRRRVL